MRIIGLCGQAGVGKSTVAEYLARRFVFARLAFADPLKDIARQQFGWDGEKDDRGRRLLQALGTEAGRAYDSDIWVKKMLARIDAQAQRGDLVIDDVRYANEAAMIRSLGGIVVRLVGRGRLVGDAAAHSSENASGFVPDQTIDNSGTLSELFDKIGSELFQHAETNSSVS